MTKTVTDSLRVVVGLGKTGYSCVRHLVAQGFTVAVMDTKAEPALADQLAATFPQVATYFGGYDAAVLLAAEEIILSPGVPIKTAEIQQALSQGIPVIGDIDLFMRVYEGLVVAITGSNGKSTVTELVGEMARKQGLHVGVGGNIGVPVLDLLAPDLEMVVLELSSFQLETVHALSGHVATVLNLSEDHMDRYADMQGYMSAKHRIFKHAKVIVANRDDVLTHPLIGTVSKLSWYALNESLLKGFCAPRDASGERVICNGKEAWLTESEILIKGSHNVMNALAALALGDAAGLNRDAMVAALKSFPGLAHRCQWVARLNEVDFINDSKATNVGAALAAIEGLEITGQKNLVLIAGGVGKGADFTPLAPAVLRSCRHLIVLGVAAAEMATVFEDTPQTLVDSMEEAVAVARRTAQAGDTVLLAPACASFDMFDGFEHRGRVFEAAVRAYL